MIFALGRRTSNTRVVNLTRHSTEVATSYENVVVEAGESSLFNRNGSWTMSWYGVIATSVW